MFVKRSLRDRLACWVGFVGKTLLCLLQLLNSFLKVCLPTSFAAVLRLFYKLEKTLYFLVQLIPLKQNPHFLQLGQNNYVKEDVLFSQKCVQLPQNPIEAVDQYI